jgi:hypothetical protein
MNAALRLVRDTGGDDGVPGNILGAANAVNGAPSRKLAMRSVSRKA